jgi:hypothetical protein
MPPLRLGGALLLWAMVAAGCLVRGDLVVVREVRLFACAQCAPLRLCIW